MNRSYRILPVYTGDVSGACSALYELGGMVVIHDPSGCNSTYNTHDETRWYHEDSLIFLSGLSELDAVLGNDDKFIRDVVEAAEELRPRFIALVSSPIPYMNGTDFPGIARLLEMKTGITTFFVPTNGMHDYTMGAGNALGELAKHLVYPAGDVIPGTVNLLGVTPLDFGGPETVRSLREALAALGWRVNACWAMGDSLEQIKRSAAASVNLVVSAAGLAPAKELRRRFGTPWTAGIPVGAFAPVLSETMERAGRENVCGGDALRARETGTGEPIVLVGEPVTMGSLATAITAETGRAARVLCPLETGSELLGKKDLTLCGEEEMETALREAVAVVADPLYRPVCRADSRFFPLPHQAFSGRCCRKEWKNIFQLSLGELAAL